MVFDLAPAKAPSSILGTLTVDRSSAQRSLAEGSLPASLTQVQLLQAVLESLVDGVMIITDDGEVLEANGRASQICQSFNQDSRCDHSLQTGGWAKVPSLPQEIWRVCQALIESHNLFPGQRIIPESTIALNPSVTLRIRVRWLDMELFCCQDHACILVTLEDRKQAVENLAIADTQKYNLTVREAEVWQLRLQGCSYQEISRKLCITKNTVQKHVKNILAKRRTILDECYN
jgi:DNA-binding CsgD family transcriptional regulator